MPTTAAMGKFGRRSRKPLAIAGTVHCRLRYKNFNINPFSMHRLVDKSELRKTWKGILDEQTIKSIIWLMEKKYIKELISIIKSGKESTILLGSASDNSAIAIKVYTITASTFKQRWVYIIKGDPRFSKIRQDMKSIVYTWCKKEFANTKIAYEAGIACPKPIMFYNNIYVMGFIGDMADGLFSPAPRLADIKIDEPEDVFEMILSDLKKTYKAGLVHGDLSEFNILYWNRKPYIIDWSQSVLLRHPNAQELLKRDIKNLCLYFKKQGMDVDEKECLMRVIKNNKKEEF